MASRFFRLGAWLFVLLSFGDILFSDVLRTQLLLEDPERFATYLATTEATLFGGAVDMLSVYNAFSLSHGYLLMTFGLMNVLIAHLALDRVLASDWFIPAVTGLAL